MEGEAVELINKFFTAQTPQERIGYALEPKYTALILEKYFAQKPFEAEKEVHIRLQSERRRDDGNKVFAFSVQEKQGGKETPISVSQTEDGMKIDWLAYLEFRDDLISQYAVGKNTPINTFRVILRVEPGQEDSRLKPMLKTMDAYRAHLPIDKNRGVIVFVPKNNMLAVQLKRQFAKASYIAVAIELKRKTLANGSHFLELIGIPSQSWSLSRIAGSVKPLISIFPKGKNLRITDEAVYNASTNDFSQHSTKRASPKPYMRSRPAQRQKSAQQDSRIDSNDKSANALPEVYQRRNYAYPKSKQVEDTEQEELIKSSIAELESFADPKNKSALESNSYYDRDTYLPEDAPMPPM